MGHEEFESWVMSVLAIPTARNVAATALEDGRKMQILVKLTLLGEKVKDVRAAVANACTDLDMCMNV